MIRTLSTITALGLVTLAAAACGGSGVSNNGTEDDPPITNLTPTPTPTPAPTPIDYTLRLTFTNIHVYENSEPFGNGELYFTFAVNDTVRYSTMISAANNSDYDPADYGVTPIDFATLEGEPIYIYVDGYDDDQPNGNDPMGTVNTGWYAGSAMFGLHSVAAENPYLYDVTYRIDWAN